MGLRERRVDRWYYQTGPIIGRHNDRKSRMLRSSLGTVTWLAIAQQTQKALWRWGERHATNIYAVNTRDGATIRIGVAENQMRCRTGLTNWDINFAPCASRHEDLAVDIGQIIRGRAAEA